jgi:C-terminal processing protease CtpA/Prc
LLGSDIPFYQEVGSTAYITFDEFDLDYLDYYGPLDNAPANDLVANVIRAHQQIMRADSPVENVVIDLSCNDGGAVDAATFLMGWITGDVPITVQNTMTGASSTATYRADVDLNHVFDENDTLAGKKVYCLISPLSFSCGNLVPCVFKNSNEVTLIGRTSAGGSCIVLPMSTAYGASFQLSGPKRLAYSKNGSFYDIDQGAEPDIPLMFPESYYDRQALTDYINSLR